MMSGIQQRTLVLCVSLVMLGYSEKTIANNYEDAIIECSKKNDVSIRLVCFDAIAEQINAFAYEAPKSDDVNLSDSQSVDSSLVSAAPITKESANIADTEPLVEPTPLASAESLTDMALVIADKSEPKIKPSSVMQAEIDSFGLQNVTENDTVLVDGELNSVIAEIHLQNKRRTRFVLANGQVWEKMDSSRVELPDVDDKVVLRSGAMGSFYLRKANRKRSFKVKRIGN